MTLDYGYLLKGRYRILDILGQGGMGAVYRAVDEILDLTVAIKENTFLEEGSARQFQREAQILASLRHPNLPRVFEYFQIENQGQYLVMDFIDGEDLREWMTQEDGITEMEALQIGIEICNALIFLHSQEPAITHRDIKPGNIKLSPYSEVILVDFGLVKVLHDQEATTTAARAMTPGYSPPEQYGDGATDHRSDVFSLGATLYTALTGYQPEDSLARTTGKAQLTPLRSYQPHVSTLTARAIEKALNLRFEDRWQSAQEFKSALVKARVALTAEKRSQTRLGVLDQPDTQRRNPSLETPEREGLPFFAGIRGISQGKLLDPVWLIFDLVVVLLLVVLSLTLVRQDGLIALLSRPTPKPPANTLVLASSTAEQSLNPGDDPTLQAETQPAPTAMVPTISPTPAGGGSGWIAYVSESTGTPQIWLVDVTSMVSTQLTDLPDGACQPDWSPDGDRIVFTSPCTAKRPSYPGSRLVIIDVEGGELTPLPASLEGDYDPAWSPNGEWIAYTTLINGRPQLIKIRVDDLQTSRLSQGTYPDYSPAWSPDGEQLAFVWERGVSQIWVMDADGDNESQFTLSGLIENSNPAWYTDGSIILFSQSLGLGSPSKQLYGMRFEDIGQAEEYPIIPRMRLDYIPLMDNVDVSPDGFWLAFDYWYFDVLSDIYMMTFPGANLIQLTDHPGMDYDPVWSPRLQ